VLVLREFVMSILFSVLAAWFVVNLLIVAALHFKPLVAGRPWWPRPAPLAFARPRRRRS
jgi:hypothetical protein